jgi:hypothetical protein
MEMTRDFRPRFVALSFVAEDYAAAFHFFRDLPAATVGEAWIVVSDDPRPVDPPGQLDQQRARVGRKAVAAEAVVSNMQKVRVDEEDETEELGSLSDAAEALRLTAAAPPRPSPSGNEYE